MNPKHLLFLALFSFITANARSQAVVGFSGGWHSTDYFFWGSGANPHYSGKFESQPGYSLAVTFRGREKTHQHVGFELIFFQNYLDVTARYGGLGGSTYRDVFYDLNYLYLSAFPEWTIGNKLSLLLSGGPRLGVLVNSRMEGNSYAFGSGISKSWIDSGSAFDDINAIDFRLFLKVGGAYSISKDVDIIVENLAGIGLSNVWKHSDSHSTINSLDYSFHIGLLYRLNKVKLSKL